MQGAGSSELLQCMFGCNTCIWRKYVCKWKLCAHHSIQAAMKNKVAMLPANRKEKIRLFLICRFWRICTWRNMFFPKRNLVFLKNRKRKISNFKDILNIKAADSADFITSLSGGNQQKVFLARWLDTDADILLLDNPTQGIDIEQKRKSTG